MLPPDRPRPRFVVGIGASAGGLEAVAELLGALPPTGMAFIVVQHLDPTHESLLAEILAKKTAMPVLLSVAGEVLQPDHVYVIPADAILTVRSGQIDLKRRTSMAERPSPVDVLFTSLAATYADYAIGVVLSGGDADGAAGIREIKHAGGFTFAQRPDTARFPNMPRHAIDTGCVDVVLRPGEIAAEIARLGRSLPGDGSTPESGSKGTFDVAIDSESARLRQIFQLLRVAHGVDFTHYKRTTIKRRIERRMSLRRIESLDDYCTLLDSDAGELAALYQDFLIRVTEFFRDPDSFDALRRYVFPMLCEGRPAKPPIRIWVPGCATGEEVYSVAIALLEYLGDGLPAFRIQIFGTDVSEAALKQARAGVYHVNSLHDMSPERLERFFVKQNSDYCIAKEIRDLCLFARQDVTRDPPFSRLDLISCRNLLIYLDEVAQRRVLRTFHYALRPQGMLFFGPAESVAQSSELFEQADKRFRVFRRMPNTGAGSIAGRARESDARVAEPDGDDVSLLIETDSLPRDADRLLLARFAPPCVLVNEALTIQQFRGQTGPYLEPAGGPPSQDLRRVVRPELLVEILPAIQETSDTGVSSRRDVRLSDGREIGIEIILLAGVSGTRSFLILFKDGSPQVAAAASPASALPESEKDRRLAQLQREVDGLREYMRAAVEEHGAVQEELRSAHEEMLSANEEFQSANEELETSKEELQSTNEELTTTVDELRSRNQELAALNVELDTTRLASDRARVQADIIIETVREPLAVLDAAQRILRVNSAFLMNLEISREQVEGRLLDEVGNGRWDTRELRVKVGALLTDAQPLEDWQVPVDLARQGRRVMSFSARKIPGDAERTDLVLLALEDVTARTEAEAGLLSRIVRKDQFIATLGHELRHPLTPIAHAVYLLRRGNPDPVTAELLEAIDIQTQRMLRFVDELLDVARISQGMIVLRRERVDFVAVAREAVQSVRPFIEGRQQELSLAFPAAPIDVEGDADRLGQVVTNLIENAAKYTPSGGRIGVTLEVRNGDAVLRVRDSGIGIETEDLERIFEPFMRSHEALAVPSTGLGLGLSVVRRILELHRGHVTVTSGGLDKGSEFVVSLPLLGARKTRDAPPDRSGNTPTALATSRPRRVLIVDDHEEIRKSLTRLVRVWGHEVALAADAPSALAVAETFRPECAIIDISMPGIHGIDLARRLRERFSHEQLFMIALTGYAGAEVREACLKAGFDEHLVKPGEINLLESLIGRDRADAGG